MVLRGALRVPSRGTAVAQGLFVQLTDLAVGISPLTFELMVEVCIEANNLQDASEFLMRMESSGHAPGNDILDRVMELYLLHKHASEVAPEEPEKAPRQPQQPQRSSPPMVTSDNPWGCPVG